MTRAWRWWNTASLLEQIAAASVVVVTVAVFVLVYCLTVNALLGVAVRGACRPPDCVLLGDSSPSSPS